MLDSPEKRTVRLRGRILGLLIYYFYNERQDLPKEGTKKSQASFFCWKGLQGPKDTERTLHKQVIFFIW